MKFNRKVGIWQQNLLKRNPEVEHFLKFEPNSVDQDEVWCASVTSGTALLWDLWQRRALKISLKTIGFEFCGRFSHPQVLLIYKVFLKLAFFPLFFLYMLDVGEVLESGLFLIVFADHIFLCYWRQWRSGLLKTSEHLRSHPYLVSVKLPPYRTC